MLLVDELIQLNIKEIFLIIGKDEQPIYDLLFGNNKRVKYIIQEEQKGLGHAVYLSKDYIKEDFILCLGDMLYRSNTKDSCLKQMLDVYKHNKMPLMGLREIPIEEIPINGMVLESYKNDYILINRFYEKPSIEFAIKQGCKYGVFGCFIFNTEIFELIDMDKYENNEIQLSTAIDKLACKNKLFGCRIEGESFDIGTPEKYYSSFCKLGCNL